MLVVFFIFDFSILQCSFQFGNSWNHALYLFRVEFCEVIFRDSKGLITCFQCVLGNNTVLFLTYQQPYGRVVSSGSAKKVITSYNISSELPGIGEGQLTDFDLNHHVA